MGRSWLYSINEGPDRSFDLAGESVPVTIAAYRQLIRDERLNEDKSWTVLQLGGQIDTNDELFVYTGVSDLGIIGYAIITSVRKLDRGWSLEPRFDFEKCRMLLDHPVPASSVRNWQLMLRSNVVDITSHRTELESYLPWAPTEDVGEYIRRADRILARGQSERPAGIVRPELENATTSQFKRDPEVRAWILKRAAGYCELCKMPAPFVKDNGTAFLESHHLILLAEGGPDTPANTTALCPNCHRKMHYGKGRVELRDCLTQVIAAKEATIA